ncbi:hypothetical protein GCM10027084_04490 [Pseudoxanthomonas sangjuensis]|uniref:GspH/FimT family protein n=1 Tax=Pseudoxanthomonas sangjuensis TaxID=1503750 RepID=UPI0013910EF5|nr:GspH/FimT family protein [Pseudoxanthomonas sangjuensis]
MSRTLPHSGFTLIEALIAMAVLAILAALALPATGNAIAAANAGEARTALLEGMTLAVRHAAVAGTHVVACPGDSGGCRDNIDWSGGWIVFADGNADRVLQPGERILREQPALADGVHLRSTAGRTRLVFQANGGNAGSNVTFTLCDKRGAAHATALVLANDGRLRASKPTATAAAACVASIP